MSWAPKQTIVLPLPDMKTEAYDPVAMSSSLACSSGDFHFLPGERGRIPIRSFHEVVGTELGQCTRHRKARGGRVQAYLGQNGHLLERRDLQVVHAEVLRRVLRDRFPLRRGHEGLLVEPLLELLRVHVRAPRDVELAVHGRRGQRQRRLDQDDGVPGGQGGRHVLHDLAAPGAVRRAAAEEEGDVRPNVAAPLEEVGVWPVLSTYLVRRPQHCGRVSASAPEARPRGHLLPQIDRELLLVSRFFSKKLRGLPHEVTLVARYRGVRAEDLVFYGGRRQRRDLEGVPERDRLEQ
mmetsp:Transcript_7093/g.24410  ORF Transcript_7093/g.24410 Transcript_7093/m.24410 type:complete len:293 (-) Transcript_7093:122-1000(-)